MSELTLVRHGQAGTFKDDYDQLSDLGFLQARHLGEHWAAGNRRIDRVFCGSLRRQRETTETVGAAIQAAGLSWPKPEILMGLNEYPGELIVRGLAPLLCAEDPALADHAELVQREPRSSQAHQRSLGFLMRASIAAWMEGRFEVSDAPTWTEFRDGVRAGLEELCTAVRSEARVVAFTSGGPISICVQTVLEAPDRTVAPLNLRVRNSSVTEFRVGPDWRALDSFNVVTHLSDTALHTRL